MFGLSGTGHKDTAGDSKKKSSHGIKVLKNVPGKRGSCLLMVIMF
jgi:hypothetical protein